MSTPHEQLAAPALQVDAELLGQLNQQGPRYTSYPTADRFSPGFGARDYMQAVRSTQETADPAPLSLYVHIPFCESLCYYCACNKVITRERDKAVEYLDYIKREIDVVAQLFSAPMQADQLHFGGGTPTYLTDAQMGVLVSHLRSRFEFSNDSEGEFSIEIDPRTVDAARIHSLRDQGFNRLSMGVQDFDEDVQRAVNRWQPQHLTLDAIAAARAAGFRSVSIDLIYGLPKQSLKSMTETLDKVIAADPDRISVYSYAHMPQMFKAQRQIVDADLPAPDVKLQMLALCINRLTGAGYVYIGMDHFAKPQDELARALSEKRLHRNFQGYSTRAGAEMLAFGVSGISAINGTYSQNEKSVAKYYERIERGELPVVRGIRLTSDDSLRRAVIQKLICHFELSKSEFEKAHHLDFDDYFAKECHKLAAFEQAGMVEIDARSIRVTTKGRLFIRNICMVFDRYLGMPNEIKLERIPYSRTI